MAKPQAEDQEAVQSPEGGISGDMVNLALPKELLDALIEILETAKQKAASDMGDQGNQQADLSGLGDELSGSTRMPMQSVPR